MQPLINWCRSVGILKFFLIKYFLLSPLEQCIVINKKFKQLKFYKNYDKV